MKVFFRIIFLLSTLSLFACVSADKAHRNASNDGKRGVSSYDDEPPLPEVCRIAVVSSADNFVKASLPNAIVQSLSNPMRPVWGRQGSFTVELKYATVYEIEEIRTVSVYGQLHTDDNCKVYNVSIVQR